MARSDIPVPLEDGHKRLVGLPRQHRCRTPAGTANQSTQLALRDEEPREPTGGPEPVPDANLEQSRHLAFLPVPLGVAAVGCRSASPVRARALGQDASARVHPASPCFERPAKPLGRTEHPCVVPEQDDGVEQLDARGKMVDRPAPHLVHTPDPTGAGGERGGVEADDLGPLSLEVKRHTPSATPDVDDPTANVSHGLSLRRRPCPVIGQEEVRTSTDFHEAVVAFVDLRDRSACHPVDEGVAEGIGARVHAPNCDPCAWRVAIWGSSVGVDVDVGSGDRVRLTSRAGLLDWEFGGADAMARGETDDGRGPGRTAAGRRNRPEPRTGHLDQPVSITAPAGAVPLTAEILNVHGNFLNIERTKP